MTEKHEVIGKLGKLMRHRDGTPISIEYSDPYEYEVAPRSGGERRLSKKTFVPRFNQEHPLGTLIEIPLAGGEYFRVANARPGQEKPDSVYVERITEAKFQELKRKGIEVTKPDNLP